MKQGIPLLGVAIALIFPAVVNAVGVVVVNTKHSICAPVTGGVTVTTAVDPEITDRNVEGAIVAAAVMLTGLGCKPLWTVDRS